MDWWQADSLLLRHSVLTLECRSESDLGRGTTGMVTHITGIILPTTTIGRTPIITTEDLRSTGTEAIDITATIVTITTTDTTKVM